MGLYNLVRLKHSLVNAVKITPAVNEITVLRDNLNNVITELPDINLAHKTHITTLSSQYDAVLDVLTNSLNDYQKQINEIDSEILTVTRQLFANNYELEERYGTVDQVRNGRRLDMTPDLLDIIKQKIALYTDWKYPALEIGCRDGEWTKYMVAADPLYIMDRQEEFLVSANDQFPVEYQARLRKYQLTPDHKLTALPQGQMAFVFSWGYFNYVSLDTMHQVLKEIKRVLRPGGVFMFSYNDGDTPAGAGMAETFSQSYMPKSILVPLCLSLGFKIIAESNYTTNLHWLEITLPGTLRTVKSHQVLGEIHQRNNIFNGGNNGPEH